MNGIIAFITAFCAGGILLGAIYILIPEGSFKKPLKYLFGVCFVCCILSFLPALSNVDLSAGFSYQAEENVQANLYAARITVETALEMAGISYKKIDIVPEYDAEGNVSALSVTVVSDEDPGRITEALKSENIKVSVINE